MSFGGFLGIGCQEYSIPWEKLKYDTQLGGFRTDITPEELTRAPVVSKDEKDSRDRRREQDLHVWMRDLLGASDDPEGWRQSV